MKRRPKKPERRKAVAEGPTTGKDLALVLSPGLVLLVLLAVEFLLVGFPSVDDMATLALVGWIAVLSTTLACCWKAERPELQSHLAMVSCVSLAALLCVWLLSAPVLLRDTSIWFFSLFLALLGASCGLTALWPRVKPPPKPVEEAIPPPTGLGPAELEKIERKVFDYVREHEGSIGRRQCLIDLGITEDLLAATLSSLEKSGRLRLKRGKL